jgi:hypothetical protein
LKCGHEIKKNYIGNRELRQDSSEYDNPDRIRTEEMTHKAQISS